MMIGMDRDPLLQPQFRLTSRGPPCQPDTAAGDPAPSRTTRTAYSKADRQLSGNIHVDPPMESWRLAEMKSVVTTVYRRPRESGGPAQLLRPRRSWLPAFAGMTTRNGSWLRI